MAVEVLRDPEIAEKGQEFDLVPLEQFTPQSTLELLNMYWNNRESLRMDLSFQSPQNVISLSLDAERARVKGVMEVQDHVLRMLGQEKLIEKRPREIFAQSFQSVGYLIADRKVSHISPLNREQGKFLIEKYQEQKQIYFAKGLDMRDPTTIEEGTIMGRLGELNSILIDLGQRDILNRIDHKLDPNSQSVNWAKNRSTGYGELQ